MSPDEPEVPATTDKKTVELCADELHKGVRCILPRGHVGDHESRLPHTARAITWKQPST